MCEASVFIAKDGVEHEVMPEVEVISVKGNRLSMADLRGRRKTLRARIVYVDFDRHKVVLEETPGQKSPSRQRRRPDVLSTPSNPKKDTSS